MANVRRNTIAVEADLEEPTYTIILNERQYKISRDKIKMLADVNGLLLTDQDKLGIVDAIRDYRISLKSQRQSDEYVVMHPPTLEDDPDYVEPVVNPCTYSTILTRKEVTFKENNQRSRPEEDVGLRHDDHPPLPTRSVAFRSFWKPRRVFRESKRMKCYKACAWVLVFFGVGLFISSLIYFAISGIDDLVLLFQKPKK